MTYDARKTAHAIHGIDCCFSDELGWSHGWRCEETTDALKRAYAEGIGQGSCL